MRGTSGDDLLFLMQHKISYFIAEKVKDGTNEGDVKKGKRDWGREGNINSNDSIADSLDRETNGRMLTVGQFHYLGYIGCGVVQRNDTLLNGVPVASVVGRSGVGCRTTNQPRTRGRLPGCSVLLYYTLVFTWYGVTGNLFA
ncbi:hypothetical protein KQX54_019464 [Cotesia glomerata]|uniref:Uncharacterized protein n=1 Tax=Cotesia glomerata TaxID=32391 RepID=A0AAV7IBK5_COTGL|nr:hypothetical protein KQX54_019464 [Cotesia glomerata]